MPSIITAGDASNGLVVASGNDGAVVIQSGLAGAKVDALSIAADGTPTYVAPAGAVARAVAPIQLGTAVATTSGTSIDFTGIPAGVKRVTVMLNNVSTNGSSFTQVQFGTSAGIVSTGYLCSGQNFFTDNTYQNTAQTSGFVQAAGAAGSTKDGLLTFCTLGGNLWVGGGFVSADGAGGVSCNGRIELAGGLTTIRLTTVNGTDAFDLGSVNISWEF